MSKHNQRVLLLLRSEGYLAEMVEHYNFYTRRSADLFGFIDVLCIHPDKRGVLGVQFTNSANFANHIKKIKGIPAAKLWLETGNYVELWGFKPVKLGKVVRYTLRRESITLETF